MGESRIKSIIMVILVIIIVGIGIAFAAFSRTLTVASSATVASDASNFSYKIKLSKSSSSITTGNLSPTVSDSNVVTAEKAVITNGNNSQSLLEFTGTSVSFNFINGYPDTTPYAKYTFYVHNTSSFTAYLNSITFSNASGGSSPKYCQAINSSANVSYFCDFVKYTLKVGSTTFLNAVTTPSTTSNISSHTLAAGASEVVEVTISAPVGQIIEATEDFYVKFGGFTLNYGTAD